MKVLPFVHEGLGNSSYLIELPNGSAALIDPDRSVHRYVAAAEERGRRIEFVLETHLHADFVSGASELGQETGARIFAPEGAECRFPHRPLAAGEHVRIGGLDVEAVASPGHTPEHMSYVLRPARGAPALFSGGSLIVGGAARTDLIAPDRTDDLTRLQHRTLREAFDALPDATLLYPTHGGGSFCSAGAGGERTSTLGVERATNALLSMEDEDEFARWFPTTFPAAPAYFFRMRPINQRGARPSRGVARPPSLAPEAFDAERGSALVVDVRPLEEYLTAHISGSLSNPFRDSYAVWLGWLVPPEQPLLFVTGRVPVAGVVEQSLLVGYERFAGWLAGGVEAWAASGRPLAHTALVAPAAARRAVIAGAAVLDVREPEEVAAGRIEGAIQVPLGELALRLAELPNDRPIVAYCGHGERATSAVSILERAGLGPLSSLQGGFPAWLDAGYPAQ